MDHHLSQSQYCDMLIKNKKKLNRHQYLLELVLEVDYIVVSTTFIVTMLFRVNNSLQYSSLNIINISLLISCDNS